MLTSRAGRERIPIRVGVAVDARIVPAWAARVIDDLVERPSVELRGAVLVPPPRRGPRPGPMLLSALERLDRRVSRAPLDALAPTPLPAVVRVVASFGGEAPDLVVDLTAAGLPADRAAAMARRVWRLQHPGGARLGDPATAFWALRAREPLLVTELVERRPARGRALYRSTSAVWPRSLYRTRNGACWKTAHFVSRCLAVAEREGWDADPRPAAAAPWPPAPPPRDRPPTPAEVVRWVRRTSGGVARQALRRRSGPGTWSVALRRSAEDARLPRGFGGARELVPTNPGDDYADPFLHRDGARVHVFAEEYRCALGRGVISCWEIAADGTPGRHRVVLEEPFHLSYPQVFEHEGRVYMLPETADAGEVRLYAAAAYPDRWRLERVLLADTAAFDPTLVRHGGRLWLFAVVPVPGGANTDELSIFHAERLEGPWLAHPANPVVSDARCARPAGRVLHLGDALVRPAQDCSRDYGYAVTFQRIDVLTPTDYRETTIGRLEPGWREGNLRTHTYNRAAGFEAVDAYRR